MDNYINILFGLIVAVGMVIVLWGIIYGFYYNILALKYFITIKNYFRRLQCSPSDEMLKELINVLRLYKRPILHNYSSLVQLLEKTYSFVSVSEDFTNEYKTAFCQFYEELYYSEGNED